MAAANKKKPSSSNAFPIVGIGASAGGLEAIKELLTALPITTGMAFVFVQHLDPTHKSLISEILSRTTRMPVLEITDGMRVEPNHVYVTTPNFNIALFHNVLNLLPLQPGFRGQHLAIDSFFQSLARDQKAKAFGVILSGTATDGTQGLRAIKSEGGLTIAQDPTTARYRGMPESAIASGFVDLILSPKEIGMELSRISKHPYVAAACDTAKQSPMLDGEDSGREIERGPTGALRKIFILLRAQTQVDFSNYKQSTILRRIQRRMVVRKAKSIAEYASYLQDNPGEIKALYNDILIHVTEFFRDPNSFKTLQELVFPQFIKGHKENAPIRVWVPGCSTGEEVYSIVISLLEFLGRFGAKLPVQIFGTDISEHAIQKARVGFYPQEIENAVSKERLKTFFEKVEGGYKIIKPVRDLCLFSRHDVTSDPPFSKLDLISCRNVLIYFGTVLQKRVIPVFHYALNPGGFLFLGKSESLSGQSKLFTQVDKTHKIFSKVNVSTPIRFRGPLIFEPVAQNNVRQLAPLQGRTKSNFQRDTERVTLTRYAPPSVTVDADMQILQFQGRTAPCLETVSGEPTNNLFKMTRPELVHGLRATIQAAKKKNAPVALEGVSFFVDDKRRTFNIEVLPINPTAPSMRRNYVIFFEEISILPRSKKANRSLHEKKKIQNAGRDKLVMRIAQLEADLVASEQFHNDLAAEFETSQEELTSANEELQSTNEELQSTNEELETSKEELQSSNEELTTVNDELQNRNSELINLSSDLNNVLNSVEIPVVIVGYDRRIRRFTQVAEKVFNLIPGDVGRPLTDIKPNFDGDLDAMVAKAIQTLNSQESEVQVDRKVWMRVQVRPYRTVDNRIDGAVITLVDITALKAHLEESQAALKYATDVADTLELPLVVLDEKLRLLSTNLGFKKMFGPVPTESAGTDLMSAIGGLDWNIEQLRQLLAEVFSKGDELRNFQVEYNFPELGHRILLLNARQIMWHDSMPKALLLSIDDITTRILLERNVKILLEKEKEARADAEHANAAKDDFLATLSHELRTPLSAIISWAQLIQREKLDPDKLKHGIEIIERSAKAQSQLVDDLLDVARIQSGKLAMKFDEIDPLEPVRLAIQTVQPLAEKKQISIEPDFKVISEIVFADPKRLQQIMWNLLVNAIKFSSEGSTIKVKVEPIECDRKKFISFKVIDQGKGISINFLANIFERFSQADTGSIRAHGGLGLGLAIVRDLTRLQGGSVRAESEGLGKGATFTVLLPVKTVATNRTPKINAAAMVSDTHERPDLSKLCVMIVDDDLNTLEALNEVLISYGAKTIRCSSVADALAAFESSKVNVLVSDIAMPSEDGYSLIRKIRALGPKRNGNVPSLAMTAYATKQDVLKALSAGFNAHMAKPFDIFRIGQEIANLARGVKDSRS